MRLYTVFHLNLAYSSIEEEQRPEVVRRCYWPLLRLARESGLPLGIEASGYTLETVAAIDPAWVDELRRLTTEGPCEFIGSGYTQIIGPLVPAEVNAANLRLGHEVYERLLGFRPRIALVNEQAYAAGLVQHYLDAGYQAIVMEWNNPARYHPEWPRKWRYLPQRACGPGGETIPVIWNDAIAFQKFQRYAHGELELEEYLDFLVYHVGDERPASPSAELRAFPLYGNDVEVFDFRPGRYLTEGDVHPDGEWARIRQLFAVLRDDSRFEIVPPSRVLGLLDRPEAGHQLYLESPEQPIPVKKQEKYNITRWAVTGRDDVGINTACWRLYRALRANPEATADAWRTLCYLWSSDFRTHITAARWTAYREQLAEFEHQVRGGRRKMENGKWKMESRAGHHGRFLTVETDTIKIRLNCRRGLAIDALWFKEIADEPLIGTLPHGHYEDIALGADYYSGHTIVEVPGRRRITDLNPTQPEWAEVETTEGAAVRVGARVPTELGPVVKMLHIYAEQPQVTLSYAFEWSEPPRGTFRTGIVTLLPLAFERETLFYRTHNGGYAAETLLLAGRTVAHGEPATALISARQGLGATEGVVAMGDVKRSIDVVFDPAQAAAMPMVLYQEVDGQFFLRLLFSLGELDETRHIERKSLIANPPCLGMESGGNTGGWRAGVEQAGHAGGHHQRLRFGVSLKGEAVERTQASLYVVQGRGLTHELIEI